MRRQAWALVGGIGLVASCYSGLEGNLDGAASGTDGAGTVSAGDDGGSGGTDDGTELEELGPIGVSGLRRLSAAEYDQTVADLLGTDLVDAQLLLPEDPRSPFDNDFTTQIASQALVEGADLLAGDLAEAVVADPTLRDQVVGCSPTGPNDEACLREFITAFGKKALRRSLTSDEVDRLAALISHAEESGDFYAAVDSTLRFFLQHPEFLYRVEVGQPVDGEPGVFRLRGTEVATRLSYLLWGSTPDVWLIDAAEADGLTSPQDVRSIATQMLEDDRAKERIARFHAMWIGYERLPFAPDLATAMQNETNALIERVIFDEKRPWQDLLRLEETFVDDTLAEHYGLASPGGEGWVSYADQGRRGLLGHGSFLSVGAKFDDTSPVLRGIAVRTRLLCQDIPPPPPNVDADEPPQADENACKEERYAMHSQGGCAGCHSLLDPVGFGLERFDPAGRYRTTELERPECEISGVGDLDGTAFEGPAELSDLLLNSGAMNQCVATQLYRFAMGRYELHQEDEDFIGLVTEKIGVGEDFKFDELVLDFVESTAFRYRREEEG